MKRLCLLTAVLAGLAGCHSAPKIAAANPDPPPPPGEVSYGAGAAQLAYLTVDTVRVRTERVVAVLPAQLVMNEDRTVRIAPPVAGRIREILVAPGAQVEAGQPLARIASADFAQANADLARAEAALAQAESALRRTTDLFEHHVIAQRDLEQARTDAAQARAEGVRARARARQLGSTSEPGDSEFVLRSPIAGAVIERNANVGAEVRPDAGVTLFTVSSLDVLWLTASVYQKDVASVRQGDRLIFATEALPDRRFEARVTYVGSALDPQTRTNVIRGRLPNPDHVLKPQMFGEARVLAQTSGVASVPIGSLVTVGDRMVVFVQTGPGRFVQRTVTVASDDGEYAAITTGLTAGDVVVTRGGILLAADLSTRR